MASANGISLKNLKHKNKIYKARVELDNIRIGTVEISDRDSNYPYFELLIKENINNLCCGQNLFNTNDDASYAKAIIADQKNYELLNERIKEYSYKDTDDSDPFKQMGIINIQEFFYKLIDLKKEEKEYFNNCHKNNIQPDIHKFEK
ncbi:MAG: hypothetical protein MR398_05685 [Oscillospiraceae bacterium]|nr:hypothetical protein [Oscillospiraceae bacterium]